MKRSDDGIPSRGSKLRSGYAQNRSIECPSYLLNWIAHRSMSFLSLTARSAHRLRAAEESSSADLNLLQFPSSDCSFRCIWASRSRTRRAVSLRVVIVVCSFASSRSFSCRREIWLCSINSRSWVHCSSIFCWPKWYPATEAAARPAMISKVLTIPSSLRP